MKYLARALASAAAAALFACGGAQQGTSTATGDDTDDPATHTCVSDTQRSLVAEVIEFSHGSAELSSEELSALSVIAASILENAASVEAVQITGFGDLMDDTEELASRRALAVAEFFQQHGVQTEDWALSTRLCAPDAIQQDTCLDVSGAALHVTQPGCSY